MKKNLPLKKKISLGQILLSLLLSLTIFAILAHAIFSLTTTSFQFVALSKARITARHLAEERIELIRNLAYDDVGTLGGIPAGRLSQNENIVKNGLNYQVQTSIIYVDDPFDGRSPDDLLSTDYKSVRVDVSWEGVAASRQNPVVLVTNIAPRGIETAVGGGTLSILVFDSNAIPVGQADIHIFADTVNPVVDLNLQTNDNGRVVLPGAPACIECYSITVTKENCSTDRTYTSSEVANPDKPLVSAVEGGLTEVSFAIDKLSTLNIASVADRDNNFDSLGNITFRLRGQKTIGTDVNDLPVYKYDQQLVTEDTGTLTFADVEWDNYELTLPGGGYDIAGTNPLIPLVILPGTVYDFTFALSLSTNHRLLLVFTDPSLVPIASVSATLSQSAYEETKYSGQIDDPDFGQIFFPNLSDLTYNLQATASGFIDFSTTVDVSGYTREKIILEPE